MEGKIGRDVAGTGRGRGEENAGMSRHRDVMALDRVGAVAAVGRGASQRVRASRARPNARLRWRCWRRALTGRLILAGSVVACSTAPALAQTQAPPLFPRPFVVEHGIVQTEPDGTTFRTPPVSDYYGGSWIVSVRPDRSRVVVDFARSEITEVRPKDGTFSVVSFARLAELRARLRRAEQPVAQASESAQSGGRSASQSSARPAPVFVFEDLPAGEGTASGPDQRQSAAPSLAGRRSVRHLRVSEQPAAAEAGAAKPSQTGATLEAWLDSTVRLEPAALAALARFEKNVIGPEGAAECASAGELLAAARERAGGAFAVRTLRTVSARGATTGAALLEDLATRLEPIAAFPLELVAVPDGFRRVPHPLETMVAFAEDEAARGRASRGASGK